MTKKSTGLLAMIALAVGLVGVTMTGCGLETSGTVQPPTDTMNNDPPVDNIVPIGKTDVELEAPRR